MLFISIALSQGGPESWTQKSGPHRMSVQKQFLCASLLHKYHLRAKIGD